MTRKDFNLLAEALYDSYAVADSQILPIRNSAKSGVITAALTIAKALKENNPRFSESHFMAVVRGERTKNSHLKKGEN